MRLKRFLTDNPVEYEKAIEAAKSYTSKMSEDAVNWLYRKPFDINLSNDVYFRLMYELLNLLKAMRLPCRGRILEVGSGPGWITEILLMLGFSVDAIEPSADLIRIAQGRCDSLGEHYRNSQAISRVRFHQTTLEEVNFEDESFDGILFFDVLHHVVDEEVAIEKSFRFLAPGGCLGIVEGAWHPDFKNLEQQLRQEMERFGTLENPFSIDYLDHLLEKSGFIDVTRYVGVNGFFSADKLAQPLKNFASSSLNVVNNLTARKPFGDYHRCYELNFQTNARIKLISGEINPETRKALLEISLVNTGETLWSCNPGERGYVTIALRRGSPGSDSFLEALERHPIPQTLIPGTSVELTLLFTIPSETPLDNWELDLVCEDFFWFSSRDIPSCPV